MLGQTKATLPLPISIVHPLVRSAYMKRSETHDHRQEDVLVLETYAHDENEELCGFDTYLIELLTDLEDLKSQAEQRVGSIDRVDISRH